MAFAPTPTSSLQAIAAQPSDLPTDYCFSVCTWSAEPQTYIRNATATDPAWAQKVSSLWQGLQADGATGAWVQDLVAGGNTCADYYSGATGLTGHVVSVVVRFNSPAQAVNAYNSYRSTFGGLAEQNLTGASTKTGTSTGLGEYSYEAVPQWGPGAALDAAWARDSYFLLFLPDGVAVSENETALSRINARVP